MKTKMTTARDLKFWIPVIKYTTGMISKPQKTTYSITHAHPLRVNKMNEKDLVFFANSTIIIIIIYLCFFRSFVLEFVISILCGKKKQQQGKLYKSRLRWSLMSISKQHSRCWYNNNIVVVVFYQTNNISNNSMLQQTCFFAFYLWLDWFFSRSSMMICFLLLVILMVVVVVVVKNYYLNTNTPHWGYFLILLQKKNK